MIREDRVLQLKTDAAHPCCVSVGYYMSPKAAPQRPLAKTCWGPIFCCLRPYHWLLILWSYHVLVWPSWRCIGLRFWGMAAAQLVGRAKPQAAGGRQLN